MDIVHNIELALVFALIGIVVFVVSFVVIDRMTPYDLWREIVQEKNMALAGMPSPGMLALDPTYASLRGNPRFEKLVKGT